MILITGATDGIGLETAKQLALQGMELVVHGRSAEKVECACDEIQRIAPKAILHTAHADISDLSEISRMASDLTAQITKLDVLVNNAGVYMTLRKLSNDGFEMTLAVNYISHFLLTTLLLPLLRKSADPRVVTVSSIAHMRGSIHFEDMNSEIQFDAYRAYADSKLANALFAKELSRREMWLTSNSLHPGVIDTKLLHAGFDIKGNSVTEGARTSIFLASSPEAKGITGKYFENCRSVTPSTLVNDQHLAQQLWTWTENAVKPFIRNSVD
jgi:NAD(P)-dependent dehydrogenase (short-subunit alcohol dehydrogenase family)